MSDSPDVLREIEARHQPFGVYDECGHQHTEEEFGAGTVVAVEELDSPYTCQDGLLYTICKTCGTRNGEVHEDSDEPEFAWPCDAHRALTGWKEALAKAEEEKRALVLALERLRNGEAFTTPMAIPESMREELQARDRFIDATLLAAKESSK